MAYKPKNDLNYANIKNRMKNENIEETVQKIVHFNIDKSQITENIDKHDNYYINLNINLDENKKFIFNDVYFERHTYDLQLNPQTRKKEKVNENLDSVGNNYTVNTINIFEDGNVTYGNPDLFKTFKNKNISKEEFKNNIETEDKFFNDYQEIIYLQERYKDELLDFYENAKKTGNLQYFNSFYQAIIDNYNDSIDRHENDLKIMNYNSNFGNERFEICCDNEFDEKLKMEINSYKLSMAVKDLKENNKARDVTQSRYEILEKNIEDLKKLENNMYQKYITYEKVMKEHHFFAYGGCKRNLNRIMSQEIISEEDLKAVKQFERKKIASGLSKDEEEAFMNLNKRIYDDLNQHIDSLKNFIENTEPRIFHAAELNGYIDNKVENANAFVGLGAKNQMKEQLESSGLNLIIGEVNYLNNLKRKNNDFINYHYDKKDIKASKVVEAENKFDKFFKKERENRDIYENALLDRLNSTENIVSGKSFDSYEREIRKLITTDNDFNRYLLAINAHSGNIKTLRMLDPANKQLIESVLGKNYEQLTKNEVYEKLMQYNDIFENANNQLFSIDILRQKVYKENSTYDNLLNYVERLNQSNKFADKDESIVPNLLSSSQLESLKALEDMKQEKFENLKKQIIDTLNIIIDESDYPNKDTLKNELQNDFNQDIFSSKSDGIFEILKNSSHTDLYKSLITVKDMKDLSYETLCLSLNRFNVNLEKNHYYAEFNSFIEKRNHETDEIMKCLTTEKIDDSYKIDLIGFVNFNRQDELISSLEKDYNRVLDEYNKYKMVYNFFETSNFSENTIQKFNLLFNNGNYKCLENVDNPIQSLGKMLELRNELQKQLQESSGHEKEYIQSKIFFIEQEILNNDNNENSAYIDNPRDLKLYNTINNHVENLEEYMKIIKNEYEERQKEINKIDKQIELLDKNKYLDDNDKIKNYKPKLTEEEIKSIKLDYENEKKYLQEDLKNWINDEIKEINKPLKDALTNSYFKDINEMKNDTSDKIKVIFEDIDGIITNKEKAILCASLLYPDGITEARQAFKNILEDDFDKINVTSDKFERIKNSLDKNFKDSFIYDKIYENFDITNENLIKIYENFEKIIDIYENSEKNLTFTDFTLALKDYLNKESDIVIADHRLESLRMDDVIPLDSVKITDLFLPNENLNIESLKALYESFGNDSIDSANVLSYLIMNSNIDDLTIQELQIFKDKLTLINKDEIFSEDISVKLSDNYIDKSYQLLNLYGDKDKTLMLNLSNDMLYLDELSKEENLRQKIESNLLNNIKNLTNNDTLHDSINIKEIQEIIDKKITAIEYFGNDLQDKSLEEMLDKKLNYEQQLFILNNITITSENIDKFCTNEFLNYPEFANIIINNENFGLPQIQNMESHILRDLDENNLNLIMFKLLENKEDFNLKEVLNDNQIDALRECIYRQDFNKENMILFRDVMNENPTANSLNIERDAQIDDIAKFLYKYDEKDNPLKKDIIRYLLEEDKNNENKTHENIMHFNNIFQDKHKTLETFNYIITKDDIIDIQKCLDESQTDFKTVVSQEYEDIENPKLMEKLYQLTEKYKLQFYGENEQSQQIKEESFIDKIKGFFNKNEEESLDENKENTPSNLYNNILSNFEDFYNSKESINSNDIIDYYNNLNDTEQKYILTYLKETQNIENIEDVDINIDFDVKNDLKDTIIENIDKNENDFEL